MGVVERIHEVQSLLRSRRQLQLLGVSDRALRRARGSGELHRIGRGWYVDGDAWRELRPADRHLAEILAVASNARRAPVFSHYSAALLHDLPLYRFMPNRVHTTSPDTHPNRSTTNIVRHFAGIDESELCRIGPLRVTDTTRTVIDVARVGSTEVALGCADAALHRLGNSPVRRQAWTDAAFERVDERGGLRGNQTVRRILELADGNAESVLESVSRLYLQMLGFEVRTQVPVSSPNGGTYLVDFELVGYDTFAEVDGLVKYRDAEMRRGLDIEQVILEEKRREDWIRGRTAKRLIRWGYRDIETLATLGELLRSFGLVPPVDRTRRFRLP